MGRRDEGVNGITQRTRVKTDLFLASDGSLVDASGNVVGLTGTQVAATQALVSRDGSLDPRTYGARIDGQVVYDGVVTGSSAGSMSLSSATANFTAADVGKVCCHKQRTVTGSLSRYGTITQVIDSNNIVMSLNGVTTGSAMMFVWGTDDAAALRATAAAAHATKKPIVQPDGICVFASQVRLALTGVRWLGPCGPYTLRGSTQSVPPVFILSGPALAYVGADPGATGAICQGDTSVSDNNNFGANITGLNICGMDRASGVLGYDSAAASNRNSHVRFCQIGMGTDRGVESSASGVLEGLVVLMSNKGTPVRLNGDSKLRNSYCYGAGNGAPTVRGSGGDIQITTNHLFRDALTPTMLGSQVLLTGSSGQGTSTVGGLGSLVVANNTFDTSYGAHVEINLGAGAWMRAVTITGNIGFQNASVPAATYPFFAITGGASSELRALSITGNVGQSSWDSDVTKGTYTYFLDASGMSGAIRASTCLGNAVENCADGYNSFTPTAGANLNARITNSASTTSVAF